MHPIYYKLFNKYLLEKVTNAISDGFKNDFTIPASYKTVILILYIGCVKILHHLFVLTG